MLNLYHLKNKNDNGDADNSNNSKSGASNKTNKSPSFNTYIDPNQELSGKKLRWGIWFTKNQLFLYKILKIFLIVFIIFIWGFSLYKWGMYLWYIPEQQKLKQQLSSSINYNNLNINYTAQPLQILGSSVFKSGVDKYDVISDISNPNENFIAYFDYYFNIYNSSSTKKQSAFLLPKQNRPIAWLGIKSSLALNSPNLIIENLRWKRISAHEISDPIAWQKYRLDFKIDNFSFTPSYLGDKKKADANLIKFTLINNSPFSYTYPEFMLSLYKGGSFVGVIPFQINGVFSTLASSTFDLRSFATGLIADKAIVHPLINVYKKDVYSDYTK